MAEHAATPVGAAWPSVNAAATAAADELVARAAQLRLGVRIVDPGYTLVDAGISHPGGIEAGRRIAEICMGGLGHVGLQWLVGDEWPCRVTVHSSSPVLACLGSQYAGWSLSHGKGRDAFHALGSGPARALACREDLFTELGYRDSATSTCLVLEVGKEPPREVIDKVLRDCDLPAGGLRVVLTPTTSLAGVTQVVARVLEVALHKAHALGFPLGAIVDGVGSAPLPPPSPDFITSMGRTNDAILFAGEVHLHVDCGDDDARDLAERLPCTASRDYGEPFARIFKRYEYDFYKIDPMLFAPARVIVSSMATGRTFTAGRTDRSLLNASFGTGDG